MHSKSREQQVGVAHYNTGKNESNYMYATISYSNTIISTISSDLVSVMQNVQFSVNFV